MSDDKTAIVMVHETVLQSWARDAGSFVTIAALVCLGVYLASAAMQWMAFLFFAVMVTRGASKIKRKTPQEASDWLYRKFGVSPANDEPTP